MDKTKRLLSDLPIAEDLAKIVFKDHYLDPLLPEMPILKLKTKDTAMFIL